MRRFLTTAVPALGEFLTLDDATSHHMLRVTGIAPGERVEIFDGQGGGAVADLIEVRDGLAVLRVLEVRHAPNPSDCVHLVLAQTRANVLDTTLRMVTELGVASIQVAVTERCVAKGDKRDRWQRIVESASAQSGRLVVPKLLDPAGINEVLESREGRRIILSPGAPVGRASDGAVHLFVGPEGGFTEAETAAAIAAGWSPAGLGQTVLRADTAALAAVVRYGP